MRRRAATPSSPVMVATGTGASGSAPTARQRPGPLGGGVGVQRPGLAGPVAQQRAVVGVGDEHVPQRRGRAEHRQEATAVRAVLGQHRLDPVGEPVVAGLLDEPQQRQERLVGVRGLAQRLGQGRVRRLGGVDQRCQAGVGRAGCRRAGRR